MPLFAVATLLPAALIGIGAMMGGAWIALAVISLTIVVTILDRAVPDAPAESVVSNETLLNITLAIVHLALLPLCVVALSGDWLGTTEKVGLFFAAGLYFGQVSNANAHELIHRPQRGLHRLGMWVYISLLFGHHTSAHVLVHHRHVATRSDPNTSRKGESLYRYIPRAWIGSFCAGYKAEAVRLGNIGRPAWRNPYVVYVGGAAALITLAFLLGGPAAGIAYIILAAYTQIQLLMSDYVQHYGLERPARPGGKPVPVGHEHSWNSPHFLSSALMLNATRHSDHHAHPSRAYPALSLPDDAPMLPKPLPLMASIALIPPLWRRMMDPLVDRWHHA
ncbi:alkane 1-monooxygenase [Cognatiyoonia sp. IB215446]|uniref:alkane 1-monooxygenase n=1 Tax=Cognatiyoonia sp. IB215446 TaxID=3097355 RepID=UPI002A17CCEA|nr:alkane 1-monooxygenase [Cognatiyoonia sp. IB215446]MDX8347751.1 alkane 1-monooxygenase [Cognatiyoonia sp. IB215446]